MAEYIEKEAFLEHMKKTDRYFDIKFDVEAFPAADVAPVVRCKECRWWNHAGCAIRIVDDTDKPQANDFCSYGERKEDNATD